MVPLLYSIGMEGSWFERDDHHLLNSLVLTTVFEYVHGLDMQSCRLVCKTWSIATLPLARSRLQVTIENMADLESFVKLMRTSTIGIPFEKFRLGSFDPSVGYGQEFVELCGNTAIEYIWIDQYSSLVEDISAFHLASLMLESFKLPTHMSSKDGQDKTVKLFQNTNSKLPSLKSLDIGRDWPRNRRKIFPTLYEELIGAGENISSFNLTLASTADKKGESEGVEILKILEKFGREKSVKNLKLPVVTEEISEVLRRMVSKGLVLKGEKLKVKVGKKGNSASS